MCQETASAERPPWLTPRARRGGLAILAAAAMLGTVLAARAELPEDLSPDEVEARFLFQLVRYVTWPESALSAMSPLVIGVLGDDAFAATLRRVVDGHRAQEHSVEVQTLTVDASGDVHVLFVRGRDPSSLRELARIHYGDEVLTVADRFDFPKLGGDVGIELVAGRVSFSINRRKSVRGDLVISSKLLRIASEVK